MLWIIFIALIALWALGVFLHLAGSLIHALLAAAVVLLIVQWIIGRKSVGGPPRS